jgi:hypothetical protein
VHSTRYRATEDRVPEITCKHENVDFRRSTKATHRVWCKDCQTVVSEQPQEEYKKAAGDQRNSHLRGRTQRQDLPGTKKDVVTKATALDIARQFPLAVKAHLKSVVKEDVTYEDLVHILEDCFDSVLDEIKGEHVAFVGKFQDDSHREHSHQKDDSVPEHKDSESGSDEGFLIIDDQLPQLHAVVPTAYAGSQEPRRKGSRETRDRKEHGRQQTEPPRLARIDPEKDKRVFALLDEGCNRTCHTPGFAKHAEKVFGPMGLSLGELEGEPKSYKGLGSASTVGRRSIPVAEGKEVSGASGIEEQPTPYRR